MGKEEINQVAQPPSVDLWALTENLGEMTYSRLLKEAVGIVIVLSAPSKRFFLERDPEMDWERKFP